MIAPIVLEGPDGGGKTTLAAALHAALPDYAYVKNVAPLPGATREQLFSDYSDQLRGRNIIDRSWPSEMIYGPLFRGGALLEHVDALALFKQFSDVGGIMVFCLPPYSACREVWLERRHRLEIVLANGGALADPSEEVALLNVHDRYAHAADGMRGYPRFIIHNRMIAGAQERTISLVTKLSQEEK